MRNYLDHYMTAYTKYLPQLAWLVIQLACCLHVHLAPRFVGGGAGEERWLVRNYETAFQFEIILYKQLALTLSILPATSRAFCLEFSKTYSDGCLKALLSSVSSNLDGIMSNFKPYVENVHELLNTNIYQITTKLCFKRTYIVIFLQFFAGFHIF